MINATHRFHGHNSIGYLHRNAVVLHAKGITLKYAPSKDQKPFRAAVIVSKKVHKSAVVRNRIRRRVYEQLRTRLDPAFPFDIAIQVYDAGFALAPAEQVQTTIESLLAKISAKA